MDEDLGVKAAPVTRLRRRLSVEAEDSLPTTPSTPTKKRSTRLAAKPQLELIDEVVNENVPKRATRKASVAKELVETEGSTSTPTPVTPSRRTNRIRSNTSILSDVATQNVESPRAKRALRRNSQLGSDTESTAVTPARQTRRTRKDSTTSVDKQAGTSDENVVNVVTTTNSNTITEEPKKEPETTENDHSPSTRKSPRLNKKGGKTDETDAENKETDKKLFNSILNTNKYPLVSITPIKSDIIQAKNNNITPKINEENDLAVSSTNLIKNTKGNNKKTTLNKSTSSIEKIANNLKNNKRNRTKSWTTLSSPSNVALSENENAKEKLNHKINSNNTSVISGAGDGLQNDGNRSETNTVPVPNIKSPNWSNNKCKLSMNTSIENKENMIVAHDQFAEFNINKNKSDTVRLFEDSPQNQQILVVIEDSDSCSVDKLSIDIQMDGDDQCVPTITNQITDSPAQCEQSVEPMDIDESMPINVTIDDFSDKSNTIKEDADIKSLVTEKGVYNHESINKSIRKLSTSQSTAETPKSVSISEEVKNMSMKKSSISIQDNFNDSNIENTKGISSENNQNINVSGQSLDKSQSKSLVSNMEENIEQVIESSNKSNNNLSFSQSNSKIRQKNNESSKLCEENKDKQNDIFNVRSIPQSIQKSLLDQTNDSKSSNNSKRTSSVSQTESPKLENSGNENKSTLVISQLKDVSTNDTNNVMSPNVTNPDGKNKGIDMKNLSLNYLTSTPIQQKPLQKITMQINTSIISSAVEDKNKTTEKTPKKDTSMKQSDSDSTNETDEKIKFKNEKKTAIAQKQKRTRAPSSSESSDNDSKIEPQSKLGIKKSSYKKVQAYENSDSDEESDTKPKTPSIPVIKKSPYKKVPGQDSSDSDEESETEPKNTSKSNIKKSPNKKVPAQDSSDSDDESETVLKTKNIPVIKNSSYKNVPIQDSSVSEDKCEKNPKTKNIQVIKNSPNKKVPALDSSDSDEESETEPKTKNIPIIKKSPNRKVRALDSSDSDEESKVEAKKVKSPFKKYPASDSSNSDNSEDEVSKGKSKFLDDKALEASDDYESGDSQEDEDRRYEAENEIVEKGETLDSEEEFSNDSDYEKDSFLVSSDAEDEDMLSGTGDDLSMSDNELTMSAKSKKKFNERKLKQQKKASKEMYNARHIDESANSKKSETTKSKKSKRQRLESSTLESENENKQSKKNNRLRIDSSQDSLVQSDADQSIGIKKKKSKRLSESVCDNTMNEKEITMLDQNTENNDPLTLAIKQEPITPQKYFNISTVAINDKIEEVQVGSNMSITKYNDTLDPLQATVADNYEDSSSSDNIEIMQNYDSILNNLSFQANKVKSVDTSLNLNKKVKDTKEPVIDQLNLTQTKKSKKNINKTVENNIPVVESIKTPAKDSKVVLKDEDSSDSIDMKLLFPEDSNDSDINASQFKPKLNEPEEYIIPLKRIEAKTNLHENMDQPDVSEEPEDSGFKIIVDTKGTYQDELPEQAEISLSKKKKNKKNKSLNNESVDIDCTDDAANTPIEASFTSEKKKKKNKSFDVSLNMAGNSIVTESHSEKKSKKRSKSSFESPTEKEDQPDVSEEPEESGIKIIIDTKGTYPDDLPEQPEISSSKKKKNKKNKSLNEESADIDCTDGVADTPVEASFTNEKKKKKNKSFDVSSNTVDNSSNVTESHNEKKSKKRSKSTSESPTEKDNTIVEEIPLNTSTKSDKKKKKNKSDVSLIEPVVVETVSHSEKKKSKKTSITVEEMEPQIELSGQYSGSAETSINSEKKKKKNKKNKRDRENSIVIVDNAGEESDDAPMEMSYKSEKKLDAPDTVVDTITASTEKKKHKKNKKKKNKDLSQSSEKSDEKDIAQDGDGKKRKRKASDNTPTDKPVPDLISIGSIPSSNKNKKRKILLDDECIDSDNNIGQSNEDGSSSKKSKKNKSKHNKNVEEDVPQHIVKKRKNRDDDNIDDHASKISKQNSLDKIHVPRLPEGILNQLTDQAKNKISNKNKFQPAIATMPFMVEDAQRRKNKPSNYLEQSVYLNDSPVKKKQKRSKNMNPKVLPFTPTVLTSDSGYTSKFQVNVLPDEIQFVAQASNVDNFKESFLGKQRIKKLGTFERCKVQRSHKLSKF